MQIKHNKAQTLWSQLSEQLKTFVDNLKFMKSFHALKKIASQFDTKLKSPSNLYFRVLLATKNVLRAVIGW